MTPKEKAKELVNMFAQIPEEGSLMWYLSFEIAKKCALICCDEVLGYMGADRGYAFWLEVKQEIQKL